MNVPKLRFKGFEGEWAKSTLKNIVEINPKSEPLESKFKYIDLEAVSNGVLINSTIINKSSAPSRAQRVVLKNDILYQTVRPYQKNNLFVDFENKNLQVVASTGYAQIRTKNKIDSKWLYQLMNTSKFTQHVLLRCTGTSYPAINGSDLGEIEVKFPKLEEQQKIGLFFEKLDQKIQLQQEKIDLLQKQKKGFLQKIFNQGQWEEYSLAKIMDFYKGKGIAKKDLTVSGIPCILYGELYTTYGEVVSKIYSKTNIENSNLFKSMKQDILIPSSGETAIDIACATCLLEEDVLIGGDLNIMRIKPDKQVDGRFISYQINSVKKRELSKYAQGASVVHLHNSDIKKLKVALPNIEDQKKIADFFEALDKKNDLERNKLIHLKEQKEGFLQQMFV